MDVWDFYDYYGYNCMIISITVTTGITVITDNMRFTGIDILNTIGYWAKMLKCANLKCSRIQSSLNPIHKTPVLHSIHNVNSTTLLYNCDKWLNY